MDSSESSYQEVQGEVGLGAASRSFPVGGWGGRLREALEEVKVGVLT